VYLWYLYKPPSWYKVKPTDRVIPSDAYVMFKVYQM